MSEKLPGARPTAETSWWEISGDVVHGRRLVAADPVRAAGSEELTWAELLNRELSGNEIYVLYFPSRFNRPVDRTIVELLRAFAENTSAKTSVDFWDPRDENFERALDLFGISAPPALVLATGLQRAGADLDQRALYCMSFTESTVLGNDDKIMSAVNLGQQVMLRGDAKEIGWLIRRRDIEGLLAAVARVAGIAKDQLISLKPKLGLPGGFSISLGS